MAKKEPGSTATTQAKFLAQIHQDIYRDNTRSIQWLVKEFMAEIFDPESSTELRLFPDFDLAGIAVFIVKQYRSYLIQYLGEIVGVVNAKLLEKKSADTRTLTVEELLQCVQQKILLHFKGNSDTVRTLKFLFTS